MVITSRGKFSTHESKELLLAKPFSRTLLIRSSTYLNQSVAARHPWIVDHNNLKPVVLVHSLDLARRITSFWQQGGLADHGEYVSSVHLPPGGGGKTRLKNAFFYEFHDYGRSCHFVHSRLGSYRYYYVNHSSSSCVHFLTPSHNLSR